MIRLNKVDSANIRSAVERLDKAKPIVRDGTKLIDACKDVVRRELVSLRSLDVDTLPEKETVIVEFDGNGGIKLDRRGNDQFDLESFRTAHPELVKQFTKRTVATYFEPLN